jgi:hypothetical protein
MLYYCKTIEQFSNIITTAETVVGTTLDVPQGIFVDTVLWEAKAHTAQAELEMLLANGFLISSLRSSNCEYLVYAHAIVTWWHLEINGRGRELVRQKYEDLLGQLEELTSLVLPDGSIISSTVGSRGESNNRRPRHYLGKRYAT